MEAPVVGAALTVSGMVDDGRATIDPLVGVTKEIVGVANAGVPVAAITPNSNLSRIHDLKVERHDLEPLDVKGTSSRRGEFKRFHV